MEKKTPLYDCHVALEGKIVPFAGYLLPVQYKAGVIAEHMAVRTACGLFDVSHMGEVRLTGSDSLANLQMWLTNDMEGMAAGQVRYSPMCYYNGGVVDDLLVYKVNDEEYFIVVNASNRDKDVAWMEAHLTGKVKLTDESDTWAQIALQGPNAPAILAVLVSDEDTPKKYYSFAGRGMVGDIPCVISRTGYTGETGFELYCKSEHATALWNLLLDAGKNYGLLPCGLGTRDTLRLEAAMPLYGHEMDENITPLETGLSFFVKTDKPAFIGKEAMLAAGKPLRKRVGIEITGRGIAREHCEVSNGDRPIGYTTSGTFSPFLQKAIAMALVEADSVQENDTVYIDVRGRSVEGKIVPLPFYKKLKK